MDHSREPDILQFFEERHQEDEAQESSGDESSSAEQEQIGLDFSCVPNTIFDINKWETVRRQQEKYFCSIHNTLTGLIQGETDPLLTNFLKRVSYKNLLQF